MTISDIMWVEKYRPKKISEVVNQKDIKGSLSALLKNQEEMPHLLFQVLQELERLLQQYVFLKKFWEINGKTTH